MSDCAKEAFGLLCTVTGTPYAISASLLLKSSDEEFLAQLKMPLPSHYLNADTFRKDYLIYSYLRKYVGLKTSVDKKSVALSKFADAEEHCKRMNTKLRTGSFFENDVERAFQRAKRKISRVLGPFSYAKVLRGCGMGPGATFDKRRNSLPGSKFTMPISVTGSCLRYAKAWLEHDVHWAFSGTQVLPVGSYSLLPSNFIVVRGNKKTTVPKDSSTDRVICIEPTFNLFLQKGVGSYMRHKLKGFGIDLDDQSRNQNLARLAQSNDYATLDLSSASDTISSSLVELLLPPDWFEFLNDIRSKETFHSKEWVRNQKFSSMGNGFTFELETLIFWALSPECETLSVYGDDIICSQSVVSEYITVLEGCGFTVNKAKSFVSGRFFESCGKHYFDGIDVTPIYQKEVISNAQSFVRAHNRVFRYNRRCELGSPFTASKRVCEYFLRSYPYERKPFIPHFADDRGFLAYIHHSWTFDRNRGIKCLVLKQIPFRIPVIMDGLYVRKLQSPSYDSMLTPEGVMTQVKDGSRVRLSSAWIQPFIITNEWLPPSRIRT